MSTLQVDRISPYQSASVQIDGDVTYTGAVSTGSFNTYTASQDVLNTTFATTGSNTFQGNQIINGGNLDLTGSQFGTATIHTLDVSNPGNTYAGFTLKSENESINSGFTFNTYGELGSDLNTILFGGGNNANSSATIFAASPNDGNVHFYKDNNIFHGNIQVTGSYVSSGSFGPNIISVPGADSQTDFFQFGGFTGNNSVVYPTAFIGLQNASGSGINHAFATTYANSDYTYFSSMVVNESSWGYFLGDGTGDYDYSHIKLVDNGNNTTTAELKADTVSINSVLQLKDWAGSLPTGASGQLAVSNNNLYYHNGTSWVQLN